jgi:hypothetical protein
MQHKPNSIFESAKTVLQTEGVAYKEDGKFDITAKIENLLADIKDQISFANDAKQQIASLEKDLAKIEKKQAALESKYWVEVDKFGFNPRNVAAPAHTALNKVLALKK